MIFSAELLSQDGEAYPNILRIIRDPGTPYIFFEVTGKHDGTKVCTTVKVERAVLLYHLKASGVLS